MVLYAHICAKIEVRIQNQRPCMRTSQVEQVNVRNIFLHAVKYVNVRIQTVCALARPHVGLHADLNGRM